MSISDELREFASHCAGGMGGDSLRHIADRIDAEHQNTICEFNDLAYASVLLPVDANGEVIRIGDLMEGVEKYDSLKKVMGKVITVSFENDGTVDVVIQVWNNDGKSWHGACIDPNASLHRHYHEPTVEDVLREFGDFYAHTKGGCDEDGIIAEYASKLRLADNWEEQ